MVNVFDVSGFLHAVRHGVNSYGMNLSGLELLLYRVEEAAGTCVLVMDKRDTNRYDKTSLTNETGYKGNRDGKGIEIEIMEDFLTTFFSDMGGVYILRADRDYEADDLIYSVCKKFGYYRNQEIIVHADDVDICACIFNSNVKLMPITSHSPERDITNYTTKCKRNKFIPVGCIAAHIIESGKESDNIKASPELDGFMNKVEKIISPWRRSADTELKKKAQLASEYEYMCDIIFEAYADEPDKLDIALQRAQYVCLREIEDAGLEAISLQTSKHASAFYTAYAAIGSIRRPRDYGLIREELKTEMIRFFEGRGLVGENALDVEPGVITNSIFDLSEFGFDDFDDDDDDSDYGDTPLTNVDKEESINDLDDYIIGESNVFS